jgi:hypothetical protein
MKPMLPTPIAFSAAVEGPTDEAVLRRIVEHLGATLGAVYGKTGKATLLKQLRSYNQAAQFWPWIVLVDLDQDAECAPPARVEWLSDPAPLMCFRIAVREVESWLLADRETLADFLGVALSRIPTSPEKLDDPKAALVNLARASRRRDIRVDMVPRPESGRSEGPAYTSRLIEYAQGSWRPDIAAEHADSLQRLCGRLATLMECSAVLGIEKPNK